LKREPEVAFVPSAVKPATAPAAAFVPAAIASSDAANTVEIAAFAASLERILRVTRPYFFNNNQSNTKLAATDASSRRARRPRG
jgi:hypothetical protein